MDSTRCEYRERIWLDEGNLVHPSWPGPTQLVSNSLSLSQWITAYCGCAFNHKKPLIFIHVYTSLPLSLHTAPSAPGDFRVVSSTSSSLSLSWGLPDPLNGQLAAYELRYGEEEEFDDNQQIRSV